MKGNLPVRLNIWSRSPFIGKPPNFYPDNKDKEKENISEEIFGCACSECISRPMKGCVRATHAYFLCRLLANVQGLRAEHHEYPD